LLRTKGGPTSPNSSGDLTNSSASSSSADAAAHDAKTMREIEQEAVAFFRKQMGKREEDWLPIVSVAGHASQSSGDVRKFVGPQNEFRAFLLKYPHVFCVRDEHCGLRGKADVSAQPFPPPSPPPKRRTTNVTLIGANGLPQLVPIASGLLTRGQSFKATNRYSAISNNLSLFQIISV
jgi:hypothetical protein